MGQFWGTDTYEGSCGLAGGILAADRTRARRNLGSALMAQLDRASVGDKYLHLHTQNISLLGQDLTAGDVGANITT